MTLNKGAAEGLPSPNRPGSKLKSRPGHESRAARILLRQCARRQRRTLIAAACAANGGH